MDRGPQSGSLGEGESCGDAPPGKKKTKTPSIHCLSCLPAEVSGLGGGKWRRQKLRACH